MNERLIVYSCHDNAPEHNDTMRYLRAFAVYVNTNCANGVSVEVLDGNRSFPATRELLRKTMLIFRQDDGSCRFGAVDWWARTPIEHASGLRRSARGARLKSPGLEAAKIWQRPAPDEIPNSLSGRILVVSEEIISSIEEAPGAHGVVWEPFAFLVRDYENILWHEAAHFFGAKDHYREDDHNKPPGKDKCTDQADRPEQRWCLMQWDPADKDCRFCPHAITEMQKYFAGEPR